MNEGLKIENMNKISSKNHLEFYPNKVHMVCLLIFQGAYI